MAKDDFVELVGCRFFREKSDCSGFRHGVGDLGIVAYGNADDRDGLVLAVQDTGGLNAIDDGEVDIHDHDVWKKCASHDHGVLAIGAFADHRQIVVSVEYATKPLTNHRMIVHEQDSDVAGGDLGDGGRRG